MIDSRFTDSSNKENAGLHAPLELVIGVDLGTTNSCVFQWDRLATKARVVETKLGAGNNSKTIPSIVMIEPARNSDGSLVRNPKTQEPEWKYSVGGPAIRGLMAKPKVTIYEIKRLMGRSYAEMIGDSAGGTGASAVQLSETTRWLKTVPYKVVPEVPGQNNTQACVAIPYEDDAGTIQERVFTPVQISAAILRAIADEARHKANLRPDATIGMVVTVPAYFNDAQRDATKEAARIAGIQRVKIKSVERGEVVEKEELRETIQVQRIINEPTAAAIAYGLENRHKSGTVVVYDMGGGTFDISIMKIHDGVFEVLAAHGDSYLGGADFDRRILECIDKRLAAQFPNIDTLDRPRVRNAATEAKHALSRCTQPSESVTVSLPFIGPKGESFECQLSLAEYNSLIIDLIEKRAGDCCKQALADAGIKIEDVNEVVLVGGMTRTPKIQEWVERFFKKPPCKKQDPDLIVAEGACLQASALAGDSESGVLVLDVTPLSLGIETLGGICTVLVPRNTTIPTRKTEIFSTAVDNQPEVMIKVLQGERSMAKDNHLLGECVLRGIKPAPRGVPQIEVEFNIDANGMITVSATDKGTGQSETLPIENASRTSKEDGERMAAEAAQYAEYDKKMRELAEHKNVAQVLYFDAKRLLGKYSAQLNTEQTSTIEQALANLETAMSGDDKQKIQEAANAVQPHLDMLKKMESDASTDASSSSTNEQDPGATTQH
jgi:molecular chaperone DnaK